MNEHVPPVPSRGSRLAAEAMADDPVDVPYDPWSALSELDDVRLVIADLPRHRRGQIEFATRTITLHRSLDPAERRCTLAHELVHLERGPVLVRQTRREEQVVAAIAARRLVPLAALTAGLRWTHDPAQLADDLGVDERTVRLRLASLTDAERATIADRLPPDP
jgi:uncharacterized protein DUF955